MPLYDYRCEACGEVQEHFVRLGEKPEACAHCKGDTLTRLVSMPATYIFRCDRGGSTGPKRHDTYERERQEGKRERVTTMLERQGLGETNKTNFERARKAKS